MADEKLFTCLKCESHFVVDKRTTECPVCGWKPKNPKTQFEIDEINRECAYGMY